MLTVMLLQILSAYHFLNPAVNINVGLVDLYPTGVLRIAHRLFQPALQKPAVSLLLHPHYVAFILLQTESVYLVLAALLALKPPLKELSLDL